jgi:O-antigen ligase
MMGPMLLPVPPPASQPQAIAGLEAAFDRMEAHPRSRRFAWLYVLTGLLWAAASVGPISAAELAGVPLGVAFLMSLDVVWPVLRPWLRLRMVWLQAAWAAWVGLSLLWTPDHAKGVWELGSLRFVYPVLAAWPLMRHRRLLVYALAAGFLATNLSQVVHWVTHSWDIGWLQFKPWHPRNAGWWSHAAVCGYMLVAALGLHLPAAMMGRGRARWIGIGGSLASIAGMLATGTRGAWIASAALIGLVALVALVTRRWSLRAGVFGLAAVVLIGTLTWVTAGEAIAKRARTGLEEARAALTQGEYETDTGARIKFARWAIDMGLEKPLQGHGAGSYEWWVRQRLAAEGTDPANVRTAPQAHNLWLHAFATLGIVGVIIAGAIGVTAIAGAAAGLTRDNLGTYDAGPAFALLGVLLTTPFDVAYVNSPPSALLGVLLVLSLWPRPLLPTLPSREMKP